MILLLGIMSTRTYGDTSRWGNEALERMSRLEEEATTRMKERLDSAQESATSFLIPEGEVSRGRAGLLFIESYRELPLLTWPRKLIDAFVELEESMAKWRGLKTSDLTDGVLETKMSDGNGSQTVVKYDVPIVRSDGSPQPLAYMLEKNREQFPGFRGDEIGDKIHEYDGLQYYAVPPKYVHFLIGSMQDNLIDKSGWALDGDLTIDITPLSPILSPNLRKAPREGEGRSHGTHDRDRGR